MIYIIRKPNMKRNLLSSVFLVVLASNWLAHAQPQRGYLATVAAATHRGHQESLISSTTTQSDEQVGSATTGSSESVEEDDSMCTRCYGKIKEAKESTKIYNHLEDKQKKLIADRQKQMGASASSVIQTSSPSHSTTSNINTNNRRNKQQQSAPKQSRNMTYNEPERPQQIATESRQIVVSRLRVVRSADDFEEFSHSLAVTNPSGTSRQRDPALKRIKHKLEKQLNKTCRAFHEVQQCLNDMSGECIGDLQYHSHEVFTKQWLIRLNCPPINDPNFKPFAALTRSIPRTESAEKTPIPRPLITPEETRKRLDAILGGRSIGPFGVMLKPTLSSSAAQKFDAMGSSGLAQLNQFRGFEHAQSKSSFQIGNIQSHSQSDFIPLTGQLLLIPCLLALMVALMSLSHRYFNKRL